MKIIINESQLKSLLEYESPEGMRRNRERMKKTGFWGEAGAGAVIMSIETGRVLMPKRSDKVKEPGTWGTWGGAIDEHENPQEAMLREVYEETGGKTKPVNVIPLHTYKNPNGFKYYNFLLLVNEEFEPSLDGETADAQWCYLSELPRPLHFGFKGILSDPNDMAKLIYYSEGIDEEKNLITANKLIESLNE